MGVTLSKTDKYDSELSESGQLYERVKDKDEPGQQPSEDVDMDASNTTVPKPQGEEIETLQLLCAVDDDDLDDKEWSNIYQTLKTNKTKDLHIAKTRFNKQEGSSALADSSKHSEGQVFNSIVAEMPTRITSANFSPHAVPMGREASKVRATVTYKLDLTEGNHNTEEEEMQFRPSAPTPPALLNETENDRTILEENILVENKDNVQKTLDDLDYHLEPSHRPTEIKRHSGKDLLPLPSNSRRIQSPKPVAGKSDDSEFDPFEGMNIPRGRVSSFGSASVYSVEEISDELYKEYFYEIRNCIRTHGFFEKFPTPSVITDAQRTYRMLDVPTPADIDGNILPYPPKVTKEEVFASQTKLFDEVDYRIVNAPEELVGGQTVDIVNYLCAGLDDDLSKIRAISTWLAIRQLQTTEGKKQKALTPEGWCKTFRSMCRFSRIKTKLVKGIVRGPSYIPGEDLEKHRGCWVSVLVNNTWWVVDPVVKRTCSENLPRISLSGKLASQEKKHNKNLFRHAETFFEDPEHFIFTHYPDDEYWQLLARPVARDEFTDLAVLRQGFFTLEMKLVNKIKAVIVVDTEETDIILAYPEHSFRQFMCKLYLCGDSKLEADIALNRHSKINLRRYVYMETVLNQHTVTMKVKFPRRGSYILDVYGFADSQPWQKMCTYRLVYEHSKISMPYPVNSREEWGSGFESLRLGLTPTSHHGGEIVTDKRVTQLVFKDRKGLQFNHELLKDDAIVGSELIKLSVLRGKEQEVVFILDIEPKVTGTLVLKLSARSDTSKPFQSFCNYLIRKIESRNISAGEDKKISKLRMPFLSKENTNEKVIIQAPESGQLQFTVDARGLSQLVVDLKLHDKQELNFSEHARHWIKGDQGFVEMNFPRKGKYSVKVLGRSVYDNRFKTVREEIIQVDVPSEKWSPFPKPESQWNSYYKVERPLTHHLEEKKDVSFTVAIKGAHDVAVLAPNGWYHLNQTEDGLWTGKVWSGPKSTKCRLLARFEIGSESFSDLMWFKIMSEEDFDKMKERQDIARENALKAVRDLAK